MRMVITAVAAIALMVPTTARAFGCDEPSMCGANREQLVDCHRPGGTVSLRGNWQRIEVLLRADPADVYAPPLQWAEQSGVAPDPQGAPPVCDQDCRAAWAARVVDALECLTAVARADPDFDFSAVAPMLLGGLTAATPVEAVREFAGEFDVASTLFAEVLANPSGAPRPHAVQFTLGQLVTAGQPAFVPAISGTFDPNASDRFVRHLAISGSALIVQPTTTSVTPGVTSTAPTPQFGSIEVDLSWTSRDTLYDWFLDIAQSDINAHLQSLQRDSARVLIETYREATRSWVFPVRPAHPRPAVAPQRPAAPASRRAVEAYDAQVAIAASWAAYDSQVAQFVAALSQAVAAARARYHTRTSERHRASFIVPVLRRRDSSYVDGHFSIRARMSPEIEFVPELPDRVSVAAHGGFSATIGGDRIDGWGGTLDGHFSLSLSGYPAGTTRSIDLNVDPLWGILGNAFVGGSLLIPSVTAAGRARVSGLFVFRMSNRTRDPVPTDAVIEERLELSLGLSLALVMPISDELGIAGTFTWRCFNELNFTCASTASVGLAVAAASTTTRITSE